MDLPWLVHHPTICGNFIGVPYGVHHQCSTLGEYVVRHRPKKTRQALSRLPVVNFLVFPHGCVKVVRLPSCGNFSQYSVFAAGAVLFLDGFCF